MTIRATIAAAITPRANSERNENMATRLYPMTEDVAKIEKLACVPAGTHARLAAIKDEHESTSDAFYDALQADADAECLYNFQLFGWGRLRVKMLPTEDPCSGSAVGERANEILREQGFTYADITEGVTWY